MSYKKINVLQTHAIMTLVAANCALGEDGFAVYADGWSDQRVAQEAIPDYAGDAVAAVAFRRSKLIGPLAPKVPTAPIPKADAFPELGELIQRVQMLEDWIKQTWSVDLSKGLPDPTMF